MDDEKRVQGFLELFRQQMERFHQTQEIEWKANFSLWALLAGSIYFAKEQLTNLPACFVYVASFIVVVLHWWWLQRIHKSEEADKELWSSYRAEALQLLRGNSVLNNHEKYEGKGVWTRVSWLFLEVGMTALLTILFIFAATRH